LNAHAQSAEKTVDDYIAQDKADGERAAAGINGLLAGVEYQIAKLDLKPGNILVVKLLHGGLNQDDCNRMQYELQKFVGRKVLIVPPGSELSVIEGTKVPK
jgi:hypothetical protein